MSSVGDWEHQHLSSSPSEMQTRIAEHDWEKSPVGPVKSWSESMKTLVRTLLASRYPMLLLWGPHFIQLYNDAYSKLIGDKHPAALGLDVRVTLAEAWDTLGPMIEQVLTTGVASWTPALMLLLERSGYREESYFSVSHAPATDDAGRIAGIFAVCSEVTQQVLGERRLRLLRDLSSRAGETRNVEQTCSDLATAIAEHPLDVPFALLYLRDADRQSLTLQAAVGLPGEGPAYPPRIALDQVGGASPFVRAAAGETALVEDVDLRPPLTGGPWHDRVRSALALPITSSDPSAPLGVLVAGVSPNRALDEGYSSFYELLAGQVSVAIRNARAHEDERRRAEALAALDRAKTAFFSNISHELRTPLTLILGPVEDALSQPGEALQGEALAAVHRSAVRLLRLVNALLDFSRIEAGRLEVSLEPTELAALTVDLASSFRSLIERAGMGLVVDCPPLPAPVHVDRAHWEKIVLNLVSNAFKFTLHGEITVSLRRVADRVELSVRDTGAGIPAEELPKIFERFHRVQGAHGRSIEGSGIGLAMVEELARLHGGSVHVTSTEGQGSTFVVSIPADTAAPSRWRERTWTGVSAAPYVLEASQWLPSREGQWPARGGAPSDVAAPEDGAPSAPAERGRVLVADDNADMRDYLVRLLRPRWAVEAVSDGDAALASARAHPPDLVLSDVMMPGLDGFGLLRELRKDPATSMVPVVLLSARAGEEAALEGLEIGADDYLVKPFSARELLTRVRTHLEMARVRRRAAEAADHRRWVESILDLMPTPLILVEPGTARVTFANKAADRMAGGEFPKDYHEIYIRTDPGGREVPEEEMPRVRAARGERLDGFLVDWHTPAGTCSLLVSSDTLHATENHPATAVVAFQDVTRLRQTEADLRRAVEARDQFLAIASHELKTPLTPLQLQLSAIERHADEIARDEASAEWLRARVATIQRQGDRLTRLINQLLDVTRITDERPRLRLEPVSLAEIVREVIARLQEGGALARARCPIELRLSTDVSGRWDRSRLYQILTNLIENALKFGSGKPVEITASADLEVATLVITDHGIGIFPEDQERIFGRFERAVSERHYGGLGLGLWITRRNVEEMGGSISVRSETGQGATFIVRLPLAGPTDRNDLGAQGERNPDTGRWEVSHDEHA